MLTWWEPSQGAQGRASPPGKGSGHRAGTGGRWPGAPRPGDAAPGQRRKQLSKHPPSQFCSGSAPAPGGKRQLQAPSLAMEKSRAQED